MGQAFYYTAQYRIWLLCVYIFVDDFLVLISKFYYNFCYYVFTLHRNYSYTSHVHVQNCACHGHKIKQFLVNELHWSIIRETYLVRHIKHFFAAYQRLVLHCNFRAIIACNSSKKNRIHTQRMNNFNFYEHSVFHKNLRTGNFGGEVFSKEFQILSNISQS